MGPLLASPHCTQAAADVLCVATCLACPAASTPCLCLSSSPVYSHRPRRTDLPALPPACLPQGLCTALAPAGCFSHDIHRAQPLLQSTTCSCVTSSESPSWTTLLAAPHLPLSVPSSPSQAQKAQTLSSRLPNPLLPTGFSSGKRPGECWRRGERSLAIVTLALLLSRLHSDCVAAAPLGRPASMATALSRLWSDDSFSRLDRKSTRLNSSHRIASRMPSSA